MKIKRIKKEGRVNVGAGGRWLPDELVIELLARLPAKTLFQCISVSKKWYSFIRDRNFIESHRRHNRTAGLLISIPKASQSKGFFSQHHFYYSSLRDENAEGFVRRLKLPPSSTPSDYKGFTQVVEGIFCFYGHNNNGGAVSVSNITTGEIMDIPNDDSLINDSATDTIYHLGFDPVNGVYKLLRIRISRRSEELGFFELYHLLEAHRTFYHNFDDLEVIWRSISGKNYNNYYRVCEILTLGRDSTWRKLHDDVPLFLEKTSIYVNGFIYWMFFYPNNQNIQDQSDGRYLLVSFDLNKEVFRLVIPGRLKSSSSPKTHRLAEFSGKLAVIETCKENAEYFRIYTLNDEEGLLWTRYCMLDLPEELVHGGVAGGTVSVGNLPTGEILLTNPDPSWDWFTPVYSYDHRDNKFKKFVVGSFPPPFDLRYRYGFPFQICCLKEKFEPLDVLFGARKARAP